jgi:DNA modification methylase
MIFTDPPYNVRVSGHVSGLGKTHHREFSMASGEMTEAEFVRFLTEAFRRMAGASCDGSIHFVCMDWRHLPELLRAGRIAYSELKNLCVWDKQVGGMGSLYRSQHEFIAAFKNGQGSHINNVELGRHGRYRSNIWRYPGLNSFQSGRDEALQNHPTVKPVALVADAILDCSSPKAIVLDPFAGSGTSIIAAERSRRRCAAIEIDPLYVDVALRRFWKVTGIDPIHAGTGAKFSELESDVNREEPQEGGLRPIGD